jgi:hypothetical protein
MRSASWWLKVKGDKQRVPNKSSHMAIEKKVFNIFFQTTEITLRISFPPSLY